LLYYLLYIVLVAVICVKMTHYLPTGMLNLINERKFLSLCLTFKLDTFSMLFRLD